MAKITLCAVVATFFALFGLGVHAMPLFIENMVSRATSKLEKLHIRSANTCADPSLAKSVYLAFHSAGTAHTLNFRWLFAHEDSRVGDVYWNLQGEVFRGWQTQQPFTVPLFSLFKPDGTDYQLLIGENATTPPVVNGFSAGNVSAWVYQNPTCGSVPLYVVSNAAFTDHLYTVDSTDRDSLVQNGWTDEGIVAFVLPLLTS